MDLQVQLEAQDVVLNKYPIDGVVYDTSTGIITVKIAARIHRDGFEGVQVFQGSKVGSGKGSESTLPVSTITEDRRLQVRDRRGKADSLK